MSEQNEHISHPLEFKRVLDTGMNQESLPDDLSSNDKSETERLILNIPDGQH